MMGLPKNHIPDINLRPVVNRKDSILKEFEGETGKVLNNSRRKTTK